MTSKRRDDGKTNKGTEKMYVLKSCSFVIECVSDNNILRGSAR